MAGINIWSPGSSTISACRARIGSAECSCFKEAGGNCLATYVPWLIHEPTEGDIRFGDVDNRDLQGFLRLAQEEGLKVLLRPGPYQYSELDNAGLPGWLMEHYPQVMAMDIQGKPFHDGSVSYLLPFA